MNDPTTAAPAAVREAPRLLLVEDDALSQDLVRALCEGRGHAVDAASDGFQGLRLLSERRHRIVLIDYHLPEMDGYALARLMREVGGNADAPLRLVGITADRHGLASRRGADALFDAILVKPLVPDALFATLDRLSAPSDAQDAAMAEARTLVASPTPDRARAVAAGFWRRRGLRGRPRALVLPAPEADAAAAIRQAFDTAAAAEEVDCILVTGPSGLEGLRALRAAGKGLAPAVDVTGCGLSCCDLAFRIDDPATWTRLADTLRAFAERRATLSEGARTAIDGPTRLLALMLVADRSLTLLRTAEAGVACTFETGLPQAGLMAAVLALTHAGSVTCLPVAGGLEVTLTDQGRARMTQSRSAAAMAVGAAPARTTPEAAMPVTAPSTASAVRGLASPTTACAASGAPIQGSSLSTGTSPAPERHAPRAPWIAPSIRADAPRGTADGGRWDEAGDPTLPLSNRAKLDELSALIGADAVVRMRRRLLEQLNASFQAGDAADAVAREAHILISLAGMLGCDRLSEACRDLEQTALADGDVAALLAQARRIVSATRVVIVRDLDR